MAKKLANFDSSKHPRGSKGRFVETPDPPKLDKKTLLKATVYQTEDGKRKLRLTGLSLKQKKKLLAEFVAANARIKAEKESKAKAEADKRKLEGLDKHREVELDHARVKADGKLTATDARKAGLKDSKKASKNKLEIKDGKLVANLSEQHESFRVTVDENHEYKVSHKGEELTLNKYKRVLNYDGDPVKGVPPILRDYVKADDDKLIATLQGALKQIGKGNSLKVNPEEHDVLEGEKYLNLDKGLMSWQIHHKDNWYKNAPLQVEKDFAEGRITNDERLRLYKENLRPSPDPSKARVGGYEIDPKPKGEREFVLLPGGHHEAQTPLFFASHPRIPHPDTGKMISFGIPDRTEGALAKAGREDGESRAWYDARFRKQLWKEYYKNETSVMVAEVNRRLSTGKLTPAKLEELIAKHKGSEL